eukprot:TRINITY_DN8737_c0_g1_i2.p1 TRINITY_DN8737_c0_g1~~TRINITY_DN8737_c0_g1_i2.p1  ORF type:complete len:178 (+),score=34.28 TRINITY_DN8737_c0_g1_i2:175-708(+)
MPAASYCSKASFSRGPRISRVESLPSIATRMLSAPAVFNLREHGSKLKLLSQPSSAYAGLMLAPEEHRRLAVEHKERTVQPKRLWSLEEENLELLKQLRKMDAQGYCGASRPEEVSKPSFSSQADENKWLRKEATSSLLKAWLNTEPSDGYGRPSSCSSTRLPSPSHSAPSSRPCSQ